MRCGNAELALRTAEEGVKLDPSFAKVWARKGVALMALDRPGDAEKAFAIAQERDLETAAAAEYAALRAEAKKRTEAA